MAVVLLINRGSACRTFRQCTPKLINILNCAYQCLSHITGCNIIECLCTRTAPVSIGLDTLMLLVNSVYCLSTSTRRRVAFIWPDTSKWNKKLALNLTVLNIFGINALLSSCVDMCLFSGDVGVEAQHLSYLISCQLSRQTWFGDTSLEQHILIERWLPECHNGTGVWQIIRMFGPECEYKYFWYRRFAKSKLEKWWLNSATIFFQQMYVVVKMMTYGK